MHATTPVSSQNDQFVFATDDPGPSSVGAAINGYYLADEAELIAELLDLAQGPLERGEFAR